jgi:hypothetical protein
MEVRGNILTRASIGELQVDEDAVVKGILLAGVIGVVLVAAKIAPGGQAQEQGRY